MIINGKEITEKSLAALIDESSIRGYSREEADTAIAKAKKYGFRSVYTHPYLLEYCAGQLKGTGIAVGTALDGPYGYSSPKVKIEMVRDAIRHGAEEIDVSMDLWALKEKKYKQVVEGVKAVVDACEGRVSKIICEVKYLTDDEMLAAADCIQEGGADYYKTSAWLGGADLARIIPLRKRLTDAKLKISGTGNYWMTAIILGGLAAGGDIFGCHDGEQLIKELPVFEQIYSKIQF